MRKPKTKILITGGAGYIGSSLSHFLKKKFRVYVIDNLSIGKKSQVRTRNFYNISLLNKKKLDKFFKRKHFDIIIHLAAHSNLRKSEKNPKLFYKNNYEGTKNLVQLMLKHKIKKIIFSSTASVYGEPKRIPIKESSECKPISVYGKSKLLSENYIKKKSTNNLKYIIFRYFNVAGSISASNLGETKDPPEHFIPIISKNIIYKKNFNLYNNFKTNDGTGIRDYIHVIDICRAHYKAITFLGKKYNKSNIFNLGSKEGISSLNIIKSFEKLFKIKINFSFKKKKKGEPDKLISDTNKSKKLLKWKITKNFDQIIKDSFIWQKKLEKLKEKNKIF
jgi:UDP-glucose 4-epimerase